MTGRSNPPAPPPDAVERGEATLPENPLRRAEALVREAAQLAVAHGIGPNAFMTTAWQAYLAAQPELQQQLEHHALATQLAVLRARGLVGSA